MSASQNVTSRKMLPEILFQVVLFCIVFVFYITDRRHGELHFNIQASLFWLFLNYAVASCIINYVLLPRLLYPKRYLAFAAAVLVVIAAVMLIEEELIEKIYFPTTRGASFRGIFFNLVGILPLITILAGFKFAYDALSKQREVEELRSTVKESELQFLKSQINPHFLFNNLNNLYAYALEQSPKTPEIILELSGVLRYMLYECREAYVPLHKEITQLSNFINLSQLQLEERGEVEWHPAPMPDGYVIAPLILTVFVENAFKHSTASQSDQIHIRIAVRAEDGGKLFFHCENSYSETSNTQDLSHGIGLENVRKRLELLYPGNHALSIEATGSLYTVSLSLQLQQN